MTTESKTNQRFLLTLTLFSVEWLGLAVFHTPSERFTRFAYCDSAADFTIQSLIDQGLRPTLDFGYIYGLLPLAVNRAWQGIFGANPTSFRVLVLICNLGMVVGFARLASTLRLKAVGLLLFVAAMPVMPQASTIVLVHSLEPALLINALAFQARGRRDIALTLATSCLFVKPAMAFVYGFILLVLILADGFNAEEESMPFARRLRLLGSALTTGLTLAFVLIALYGAAPLFNTLLPGAGLEVYRQNGYGFFRGAGRAFWWIPGGGLRDYLRYEVGAWIGGSLVLLGAGASAAFQFLRRKSTSTSEIVLTTALLHGMFVAFFFGNRLSWVYYYPILMVGLAALSVWGRRSWALVLGVALLIVIGSKARFETAARLWKDDRATAETFHLWATPTERAEWIKVKEFCRGERAVALLANVDGLALFAPTIFLPPTTAYLVPGHPLPSEVRRKADQIASVNVVVRVRPGSDPERGGYERWPEIAKALEGFETVWDGEHFDVERRRGTVDDGRDRD